MSFFAEMECRFLLDGIQVLCSLIHQPTCRFEACQALIYQLVLGLTGKNGKYNYPKAVHLYPPFFDIFCSAKNYKIAPALTVIFLTANDMESDMLKGFELGADDYVTKPFPISVFRKKVSALLGRIQKQTGGDCYTDGTLSINFSELTATLANEPIIFTPMEYRLLKVLVRNPQIVLTRQVLLEKLWDADENFVDEHALTVAISRIRGKIEIDGLQYIKTVYGMGYMWIGGLKK